VKRMFWQWFFVVCKTAGKIETETAKISDQQKMSVGKSNSRKTGGAVVAGMRGVAPDQKT